MINIGKETYLLAILGSGRKVMDCSGLLLLGSLLHITEKHSGVEVRGMMVGIVKKLLLVGLPGLDVRLFHFGRGFTIKATLRESLSTEFLSILQG